MDSELRYQVVQDDSLVGEEHMRLRDAVLVAAAFDGHAARFVRDKHNFMCFYASRVQIRPDEYVPAPCDAFRPWSPLADDLEAEEEVAKMLVEAGDLHSKHKDLQIITLTYSKGTLTGICENASPRLRTELLEKPRTASSRTLTG